MRYFGTTNLSSLLLSVYCLDENALRKFLGRVKRAEIITDHNLRLEFDTPQRLFAGTEPRELITEHLLASARPAWIRDMLNRSMRPEPEALHKLTEVFYSHRLTNIAEECVTIGLLTFPDHPALLSDHILLCGVERALLLQTNILGIVGQSAKDANRAGVALWGKRRFKEAVELFRVAVDANPYAATCWAQLAVNCSELGDDGQAENAFVKAVSLDAASRFAQDSYSWHKLKMMSKLASCTSNRAALSSVGAVHVSPASLTGGVSSVSLKTDSPK